MKEFIKSLVSDNAGGWSTMRLVVLLWCIMMTVTWAIVAISTRSIPDIPTGVLGVTTAFLGAKAIQRIGEVAPATTETAAPAASPAVTTTTPSA